MSVENPFYDNQQEKKTSDTQQPIMEVHSAYKEQATETQNKVAEWHEAKLGIALRILMERTDNNAGIINGLRDVLESLDHQANFGESSEPLHEERIKELASFLQEAAKALRWTVNKSKLTNLKIDFSKWEQ